jgi:hypothetical protein
MLDTFGTLPGLLNVVLPAVTVFADAELHAELPIITAITNPPETSRVF